MSERSATAVVAYPPETPGKPTWRHETITLIRSDPGPKEVLVRMVASGICHTDIFVGSVPQGAYGMFPKVLGHEGSGYVEAIGSEVTSVAVGDPVLLSYTYCGKCDLCDQGHPTYCQDFGLENAVCPEKIWNGDDGEIGGKFFGQSSFASLSLVGEKSIVNVKDVIQNKDNDNGLSELKILAPLGCGLMTGSGAILNTANAQPSDSILVLGLGAVGLSVIMTAKIIGCKTIIAVDRIKSRLDLAAELGATHTFDTNTLTHDDSGAEITLHSPNYASTLASKLKSLSPDDRINYAFETTGLLPLTNASIRSLSKMGKLIQIGVPVADPSDPKTCVFDLDMMDFFAGTKRFEFNYLGDCVAETQVKKMIGWWREGRFPVEKLIGTYRAEEFERALEGMKGDVVKPVILH